MRILLTSATSQGWLENGGVGRFPVQQLWRSLVKIFS